MSNEQQCVLSLRFYKDSMIQVVSIFIYITSLEISTFRMILDISYQKDKMQSEPDCWNLGLRSKACWEKLLLFLKINIK